MIQSIELATKGINNLADNFTKPTVKNNNQIDLILKHVLPYTAKYWIKCFEKSFEAYYCAQLIKSFKKDIEILDIGSGSGQMIAAIVEASGKNCIVDGLDNFQESDTHENIFNSYSFTRNMYNSDFNKSSKINNNKYDLIIGLNSIRISTDLTKTIKNLSQYLKPEGLIVFNVITNKFIDNFFKSTFKIANDVDLNGKDRWSTAKNYIDISYDKDKIEKIAKSTGLKLLNCHSYLNLNKFSPYKYFTPAYQFCYSVSNYQQALDRSFGEIYSSTYTKFIHQLSLSLPTYIEHVYEDTITGNQNGCHIMATLQL